MKAGDTVAFVEPAGKAEVYATLNGLLRKLLKQSGRSQIFIEKFSGVGRVAQGIKQVSGYPCLCIDIKFGRCMDFCNPHVVT